MKGKVKRKVVTSGRLSGASRGSVNTAVVRPEPAYSLYSTDSDNQVSTLHQGLDRCAALLSELLQAEHAGKSLVPTAEAKPAAPPTSQAKKVLRKPPTHAGQQRAASNARARLHSVPAAAVKLQPPHRGPPPPHRGPPPPYKGPAPLHRKPPVPHTRPHVHHSVAPVPPSAPPPHSSVLLSVHQSSSDHRCVPEAPPTSQLHQEEEEDDLVPVRDSGSVTKRDGAASTEGVMPDRAETLQNLLTELNALITGHGSVAEMLLSRLELVVSSSLQSSDTPDLLSLQSENAHLRRRVRTLNQQLQQKEEAEKRAALREDDLAELRRALEDRNEENARLQTDLEEARRRLQDGEQQRRRLEEELRNNDRLPRVRRFSGGSPVTGQDSSAPPADRIAHYLESLSRSAPLPPSERPSAHRDPSPEPDPPGPPHSGSAWSESSFNTRDEAAFRDGLAALDASIASLQRSIQLDLRR